MTLQTEILKEECNIMKYQELLQKNTSDKTIILNSSFYFI